MAPLRALSAACVLLLLAFVSARTDSVPQPVGGTDVKGKVLTCVISGRPDEVVARMVSVDMSKPRKHMTRKEKRDFYQCFSGGRGRRRAFYKRVPGAKSNSTAFGGTVKLRREGNFRGSNITFVATNSRKENLRFSFTHYSLASNSSVPLPLEKVVAAGTEAVLTTLTPKEFKTVHVKGTNTTKSVPTWKKFDYFWMVDPVQYLQQEVVHQLYSNNVFLAVQHKPSSSSFVVFNERHEIDAPIRVWMNVVATSHSSRKNLRFTSNGKETTLPLELQVMPREKRAVLEVAPVNIAQPWAFRFEYRWSAGVVPSDMFGIPHPQMAIGAN